LEACVASLEQDYGRVLQEGDKKINKLRQENHALHKKAHHSKENAAIQLGNLKSNYDHIKQKYETLCKTSKEEVCDLRDTLTEREMKLDEKNQELQKMELTLKLKDRQVKDLQYKSGMRIKEMMERNNGNNKPQLEIYRREKCGKDR